MVRLFYQVFAALALVSGTSAKVKCISTDDYFGGTHGEEFADIVDRSTNITGIFLNSAERLDAIGIIIDGYESVLHGGYGGERQSVNFDGTSKIVAMEVHRAKHYDHTRIVYVEFTVSDGQNIKGGTYSKDREMKDIKTFTAEDGAYLIGFVGRAGDEIDALGGQWLNSKCAKRLKKHSGNVDDESEEEDDSTVIDLNDDSENFSMDQGVKKKLSVKVKAKDDNNDIDDNFLMDQGDSKKVNAKGKGKANSDISDDSADD
ncbi:hypothetical protein KXD40_005566 [Peronospora effusa]|nr:hypothetical protein KXD40_005566 [Peronospora effusa]